MFESVLCQSSRSFFHFYHPAVTSVMSSPEDKALEESSSASRCVWIIPVCLMTALIDWISTYSSFENKHSLPGISELSIIHTDGGTPKNLANRSDSSDAPVDLHISPEIRTELPTSTTTALPTTDVFMLWHNNLHLEHLSHDEYCDLMYESLMYVANCSWSGNISFIYSLLITATPRSGTVFTKTLLNSVGIQVVDDWHSPIPNQSDGQVSWMDAFYEEHEDSHVDGHIGPSRLHSARFRTVIHQIREPLASMTSMCTEPLSQVRGRKKQNYLFIDKHIDGAFERELDDNAGKVEWIMAFYYHWHQKLNQFGFPIFRVENFFGDNQTAVDTLKWIIERSELQYRITNQELMNGEMTDSLYHAFNTKVNARKHRKKFTWNELFLLNEELAQKLLDMAREYGYQYEWDYDEFVNQTKHNRLNWKAEDGLERDLRDVITCECENYDHCN